MIEYITLGQETNTNIKNYALINALRISRNNKGVYSLSKTDLKNGYYFEFERIKVPFKAIVDTNNKLNGIFAIGFGNASECPSKARGLCQLPTDKLCYAQQGQLRATKKGNECGTRGMDATLKGELWGVFWDAFALNDDLKNKFIEWLNKKGVDTLRFNLKSDFRHEIDIACLYWLANHGFKLVGYTARDDLAEWLKAFANCRNVYLNGSNRKYTNRFRATDNIEEYLNSPFRCLGSCQDCLKCYTLKNKTITCLIHGTGSDTALNHVSNQTFINKCLKVVGISLKASEFEEAKGLTTCINKALDKRGLEVRFKNTKELLNFITKISVEGGLLN